MNANEIFTQSVITRASSAMLNWKTPGYGCKITWKRLISLDGVEHLAALLQMAKTNWEFTFLFAGLHFIFHLAFGGYCGDMSIDSAPYE